MNLEFVSCKSSAQSMVVTVKNVDTGVFASAAIDLRTCGGPFLQHDASVGQLIRDLLVALNAQQLLRETVAEAAVVDEPAKKASRAPKGAA